MSAPRACLVVVWWDLGHCLVCVPCAILRVCLVFVPRVLHVCAGVRCVHAFRARLVVARRCGLWFGACYVFGIQVAFVVVAMCVGFRDVNGAWKPRCSLSS